MSPADTIKVDTNLKNFSVEDQSTIVLKALNTARSSESYLLAAIQNKVEQEKGLNKLRIEWHKKFTLGFACLIMFFVGAPFGALVRKGGFGVPVIVSFVFYLMYYILTMIGEKGVKIATMSPWFGMWYPIFVILIAGIFLTYLAVNDKSLPSLKPFVNEIEHKILERKRLRSFRKYKSKIK